MKANKEIYIRFRRTCDNKSLNKLPKNEEVTPTVENGQNELVTDRRNFLKKLAGAAAATLIGSAANTEAKQNDNLTDAKPEQESNDDNRGLSAADNERLERFTDLTKELLNGETKLERAKALEQIALLLCQSTEITRIPMLLGLYLHAKTTDMPYGEAKEYVKKFTDEIERIVTG